MPFLLERVVTTFVIAFWSLAILWLLLAGGIWWMDAE
jgi:hypothetical protein